jgi:hypothetical protein
MKSPIQKLTLAQVIKHFLPPTKPKVFHYVHKTTTGT